MQHINGEKKPMLSVQYAAGNLQYPLPLNRHKFGIPMVTLREVEDTDIIPLADFLSMGFPYTTKEFWVPLFELWWNSNPAYTDQFPRGWVLEQNSSIVGFIGNIPVKFLIRGVVHIAAVANSWYVDPSVRGLFSLKLFNEYLKQKSASLFFFKRGDDEHVLKILSKYQFEEYILPKSQKEYVYILQKRKAGFIFGDFLLKNRIPRLSELRELYTQAGLLVFTYLYQKSVSRGCVFPSDTYISSVCTSCDESFSRIWEPSLKSCEVALSRDTKTLNWLYFASGRANKRVVIQCNRSRDKTLAGYMVFDIQRMHPSGEGIMSLMDICIENNDPHVLASLISFAIATGKQNNAALLLVWANSQETELYFRRTFTVRMNAQHYRYIRFSELSAMNLGRDHSSIVCPPLIFPPQ
jgi:hypothetical protein